MLESCSAHAKSALGLKPLIIPQEDVLRKNIQGPVRAKTNAQVIHRGVHRVGQASVQRRGLRRHWCSNVFFLGPGM
jgi:hypothetical protein